MALSNGLKAKIFRWKRAYQTRSWDGDLAAAEKMKLAALSAMNWERRRQLVRHCALHVPFYRERFRKLGFHPDDLTCEAVFAELPVLEKEEIREHRELLIAEGIDRRLLRPSATGGTTGQPLEIYHDGRVPLSVMTWRMLNWWGVDVSDNSGYLYRAVPKGFRRRLSDLALFPTRRAYIQAAEMDQARMQAFWAALNRFRVRYLVGYVGAIEAFADFLNWAGLKVSSLQAVWTTASPLPQPKRLYLQNTFSCPVYTQYGSVEVFILSAECRCQAGLHVFTDIRHVETIGADGQVVGDGHHGDLVVTDLTNYAFPLLRYRIGDRGRMLGTACQCGRPFPVMDYVTGRVSDQILLPDGTSIPGEFWTTIFDDWPAAIKGFEVHQAQDYSITVRYEPSGGNSEKAVESVRKMLIVKLRGLVPLAFEASALDPNRDGKTRYIVSEVSREHS